MCRTKNANNEILRSSTAEYLTIVAATGESGVEVVYADENIWLSQKMMGTLYNVEPNKVNYHLWKIFADYELDEHSVIRDFRITAADSKENKTKYYKFIEATDRKVLQNAGAVTAEIAKAHAEAEFEKLRIIQDRLFESDFDRVIKNQPPTNNEIQR